jgi:hypothetical protein
MREMIVTPTVGTVCEMGLADRVGRASVGVIPGSLPISHLGDENIDRYVLDHITNEGELEALEEHLLICTECQAAVEATSLLREALQIEDSCGARSVTVSHAS